MDTLIRFTYSTLIQNIQLEDELPTLARDPEGASFWETVKSRLEPQSLLIWADQEVRSAGLILHDQSIFFFPHAIDYLFIVEQKVGPQGGMVALGAKLKDPAFSSLYLLASERPYSDRGMVYFQKVCEKLADLLSLPMEWEDWV